MILRRLAASAAILALLTGAACSGDEQGAAPPASDEYTGVCVDPDTEERIPEDRCGPPRADGSSDTGYLWLWILLASQQGRAPLPGYGYPVIVDQGYTVLPAGARYTPAPPATTNRPSYKPPRLGSKPTAKPITPRTAPPPAPRPVPKAPAPPKAPSVPKAPPAAQAPKAPPPPPRPAPPAPRPAPPVTRR
jgi:hypothetical protein